MVLLLLDRLGGRVRPVAPDGFFADEIVVSADGQPVVTSGGESADEGWTLDGFRTTTGTETQQFDNFYIMSNRTYTSFDRYLQTGPYNFGFPDRPDFVEHFPYQQGLLVSYWDTSQPGKKYCRLSSNVGTAGWPRTRYVDAAHVRRGLQLPTPAPASRPSARMGRPCGSASRRRRPAADGPHAIAFRLRDRGRDPRSRGRTAAEPPARTAPSPLAVGGQRGRGARNTICTARSSSR
jgi:hypothetical protein